jgi:hypothetical protein
MKFQWRKGKRKKRGQFTADCRTHFVHTQAIKPGGAVDWQNASLLLLLLHPFIHSLSGE